MYNLLPMKWFPDKIDGSDVKTKEELEYTDIIKLKLGPDRAKDYLRSLQESDQVELPEHLYSLIDWVSGPGHLLINPLFLKMYRFVKYRSRFSQKKLIIAGAILSLIINGAIYINKGSQDAPAIASELVIYLCGGILLITLLRMLYITLVIAPRAIANELEKGVIHSVFSTPLSDDEIFYGVSMAHLLKAYPIIEEAYVFISGYIVLFILFVGPLAVINMFSGHSAGIVFATSALFICLVGMVTIPVIAILTSRAAGLFSVQGNWLGVLFSGIGHLMVTGLISWLLAALIMSVPALLPAKLINITTPSAVVVSVIVVWLWLTAAVSITGMLGVWTLGRFRRKSVSFWD